MDEFKARVLLSYYAESANEKIGTLIAEYGASETLTLIKNEKKSSALSKKLASANFEKDYENVLKQSEAVNAQILTPENIYWPKLLNDLDYFAPYCLWVRGDFTQLNQSHDAIAVVGARAATNYGERIASEIGSLLGEWGITSISGAAYGIDAAVHRGSIAAGGNTFAVLACGIDQVYPSAHRALVDRICDSGAVITEAPPGSLPLKHKFLTRNRIIAALSKEVVVVEAALRSGSLSTANWANVIGRKVWGVPGPITSATSAGVHTGIRNKSMEIMLEPSDLITNLSI